MGTTEEREFFLRLAIILSFVEICMGTQIAAGILVVQLYIHSIFNWAPTLCKALLYVLGMLQETRDKKPACSLQVYILMEEWGVADSDQIHTYHGREWFIHKSLITPCMAWGLPCGTTWELLRQVTESKLVLLAAGQDNKQMSYWDKK